MTTDGFSVSNKATKEGNSDAFDLGVKLQPTESCPFNTMMVHHVHPYRPFPSNGISDGNGATCDIKRPFTNDTCDVVSGGVCGAAVAASVGAVGVRSMQPFDISPTEATTTAFKSPGRKFSFFFLSRSIQAKAKSYLQPASDIINNVSICFTVQL